MLKQSLNIGLSQHQSMSVQLQQAIRLLQLSTLELQTEIGQALDSNIMLELDQNEQSIATENNDSNHLEEVVIKDTVPDELPLDSHWQDTFDNYQHRKNNQNDTDTLQFAIAPISLQQHLINQLVYCQFNAFETHIAYLLIDAINSDGYLIIGIEEIKSVLKHPEMTNEIIHKVLTKIKQMDPPGIATPNLTECLLSQLDSSQSRSHQIASKIIQNHLPLLAKKEFKTILHKLGINLKILKSAIHIIQTLNPKPGQVISETQTQYITPDIIVKKHNDKWVVNLNQESLPKIRINNEYSGMIKRADKSKDNTILKDHLQQAKWLLTSLQSRHDTLLKVATTIIERQYNFLEYGEEAMQPLGLREIAEHLNMHESTISRATTNKYMLTPKGLFNFKYFFSTAIATSDGQNCSAITIRALIKKNIAAENPNKPLSDNRICKLLEIEGIKVARRTIAKYREALAIPASNERKRLP